MLDYRLFKEFLAGHAVRWQGTGSAKVFTWNQKSKNPDKLPHLWRGEKVTGAHLKLYRSCCSIQGVYVHVQKSSIPSALVTPSVQHKCGKV
ncbi:repA3-like domain protein (plasmid) [Yersinia pseudotuberculosis IP 32953]|nr:repA3-like domain protein [Yersinia pestis]AJJ53099.1 repA3-like domain protein [Yersinia pseudotuberculosis IP 32953]AJJ65286.1 repA3-like domain protein [Yersinia pseudotuberculosis PB1/+]AJK18517.1 repA3-like domain protein [Yersinia pseudotuberculosis str. PA3606]KNC64878.1 repA3-like domain protein [Yersinia pestis 14735]UFA63885.1 Uncharacterized protein YP598_4271 [Yersinia pseudotuberculosis]